MSKFQTLLPQNRNARILWFGFIFVAFLIGWMLSGGESGVADQLEQSESQAGMWTCSMHPNVQQPNPGQCPICGMDLIPVKSDGGESLGPRQIKLSENARKLAEIEVATVVRKFVAHEIRKVGKVEYDETRLGYISAWFPGRIDRLYVNYTGIRVKKGDHLVEIYSPDLLTTQQELFESLKNVETMKGSTFKEMTVIAQRQLESVRERLRLWGLTADQIKALEKSQQPSDHITLYSPLDGVVVHKNALEGIYVKVGSKIYTIADLSQVWVKMDAYESDLPWLRYGQEVQFSTESYPGEIFKGRIAFIDPVLNAKTRTVKIRVNVDNSEGRLKPEMFVRGTLRVKLTEGGQVMDPTLAGKWISPMHPEIVKDGPGKCDVCGMPLVPAEELGFVSASAGQKAAPLVIPATAPLITGKRAVVYVVVDGQDGVYEGRELELGPRAGDYYLVKTGLKEGDRVVKRGNFKIDSAIQIQAKPSMMNPDGGGSAAGHQHGPASSESQPEQQKEPEQEKTEEIKTLTGIPKAFQKQLDNVYAVYYEIQNALSHDQFESAQQKSNQLIKTLGTADMSLLKGESHMIWMARLKEVGDSGTILVNSKDIKNARTAFDTLSQAVIKTAKQFCSDQQTILVYHCPMAFDGRGADWLQNRAGTENPYFGSQMFKCGSQTADLTGGITTEKKEEHKHE